MGLGHWWMLSLILVVLLGLVLLAVGLVGIFSERNR